ncbi:MAG: hypothetical protein ACO3UM_19515, partial [Planctomycetota bacterium]
QKLLRRYRGQFVAAGLVLASIVVGGLVAAYLAVENAALAEEKTELAQAEAAAKTEAQTNLQKFEAKAAELNIKVTEFNQLAGVVRYEAAVAGVEQLLRQAAWPAAIPAMESWLGDCDELLGMRAEIEDTIDSLRRDALPWDEARQQAFARADPDAFARWQLRGRQLTSLRHAQAVRDGVRLSAATLTEEQRAMDAPALNSLAWARVAPEPDKRTVWGEEPLGLAAARLAVEQSEGDPARFQYLDTLAWALLANGQDAAARRTSEEALAAAPVEQRPSYEGSLAAIIDAVDRAGERLAAAEEAYEERPFWEFAPEAEAQAFLHDTLEVLLGKLDRLESTERAVIAQRLSWARQI